MLTTADRLLDLPAVRRSDAARSFITGAWLGWQIESNWASPFLFTIYAIARPLASALIIVVMYSIITQTEPRDAAFAYVYLGNTLYILVTSLLAGAAWGVTEDREHYRTIKQLYTTPMNGYWYLLGRSAARVVIGSISVAITLGFGWVVFQLPICVEGFGWVLLILGLVLGVAGMTAFGQILGAITMQMAKHFYQVGDSVAGALFLLCGTIFPLTELPGIVRWIGYLLQPTYWLEIMRRALLGTPPDSLTSFSTWSDAALLGMLALLTAVLIGLSVRVYAWSVDQAREKGILDMETNY